MDARRQYSRVLVQSANQILCLANSRGSDQDTLEDSAAQPMRGHQKVRRRFDHQNVIGCSDDGGESCLSEQTEHYSR